MNKGDAAEVTAFLADLYDLIREVVPGDTTLNELAVLAALSLASEKEEPVGVSEIAERAKVTRATASRLIAHHQSKGAITEGAHPTDGRRKTLPFAGSWLELSREWCVQFSELLKAHEKR
mgnify:CR=1 FL=1